MDILKAFVILWVTFLAAMVLIAFFASSASAADLPESADLTFVDRADLDAQVDSILAVCDTVYWSEWYPCWYDSDSIRTRDSIIGLRVYAFYGADSTEIKGDMYGRPVNDSCRTFYYPEHITCRRWAGLCRPSSSANTGAKWPRTGGCGSSP